MTDDTNGLTNRFTPAITFIAFILSCAAITGELVFSICSTIFYDPFPNTFFRVITCSVPPALLFTRHLLQQPFSVINDRLLGFLMTLLLSLGLFFTIVLFPTAPTCIFGIIVLGLGLLGLCPYLVLTASLLLYVQWCNYAKKGCFSYADDTIVDIEDLPKKRGFQPLLVPVLTLLLVVAMFWSPLMLGTAGNLLHSSSPTGKYTALWILRHCIPRQTIIDACTSNTPAESLMETRPPFCRNSKDDRELLMEAYFFIYGTSTESQETASANSTSSSLPTDRYQGTGYIGPKLQGLSLQSSSIAGRLSHNDATYYTEWTMEFANNNSQPAEARALVKLPPFSVVSKVSLWINGVESQAAFGPTGTVTNAYRKVVQVKRDPLLVTFVAPDVIRLHCFPVTTSSTMKLRIGITSSIDNSGICRLPHIFDSNFLMADNLEHDIHLKSDAPVTSSLHPGSLPDRAITMHLNSSTVSSESTFFYPGEHPSKLQANPLPPAQTPSILVLDGTPHIIDLLLRTERDLRSFDKIICAQPFTYSVWDHSVSLRKFLNGCKAYSAVNPAPALLAAIASAQRNTPIVWMHSASPINREACQKLRYALSANYDGVIISLAINNQTTALHCDTGANRYLVSCPATGDVSADINRALTMSHASQDPQPDRRFFSAGGTTASGIHHPVDNAVTGSNLYTLKQYSNIMSTWYRSTGTIDSTQMASATAAHIITPVTAAVVLESNEQYQAEGLVPGAPATHVPEPETVSMLIVALLFLSGCGYIRRGAARQQTVHTTHLQ